MSSDEELLKTNPFAQLFGSDDDALNFMMKEREKREKAKYHQLLITSEVIENSLLITFDGDLYLPRESCSSHLLFCKEFTSGKEDQCWITVENLNQVLFDRLRLVTSDAGSYCVLEYSGAGRVPVESSDVIQPDPIWYLYSCFHRASTILQRHVDGNSNNSLVYIKAAEACVSSVVQQASLYLVTSHELMLMTQDGSNSCVIGDGIFALARDAATNGSVDAVKLEQFLTRVMETTESTDTGTTMLVLLQPLVARLLSASQLPGTSERSLFCPERHDLLAVLSLLLTVPAIAEVIVDASIPVAGPNSAADEFEKCLLGRLLCPSHLPPSPLHTPEFFTQDPLMQHQVEADERTVFQLTSQLWTSLGDVFLLLFRAGKRRPAVRTKLLHWIGACLHANRGRSQLSRSLDTNSPLDPKRGTDGFSFNLTAAVCRLASPLLDTTLNKTEQVLLSYTVDTREMSLPGLPKETALIPREPHASWMTTLTYPDVYPPLTELFFLTHRAFKLSFCVISESYVELNQNLQRVQDAWREVTDRGGENSPEGQQLRRMLVGQMSHYMSLGTALRHPTMLQYGLGLTLTTSHWLCRLATTTPHLLACVPEFFVDNMVELVIFLRRFKDDFFESAGMSLDPLLEFVVLFMGDPGHLRNPYLRAKLANVLETLIPYREATPTSGLGPTFYLREQLLSTHLALPKVVQSLLSAFVTMELAGDTGGVRFEQKFGYRQPMYACMRYFYGKEMFDEQFKMLETEALSHIDDPEAPLMLRFLNLLINDSIYLLDEALSYLVQIKAKEAERMEQGGRFRSSQEESSFHHITMLTRYHNSLGRDTIDQLWRMTTLCARILTHPVLVDRIACMLNYFLDHLVGPKQRDLTVRDKEAYSFRPGDLVTTICRIYMELGQWEPFRTAVVSDGRSYTSGLLDQAAAVLTKIRQTEQFIVQFGATMDKIKAQSALQSAEEEAFDNAPDEFLDPIMGYLMRDPVRLPTSGQVVDRRTIYRHLLSDTTDPFNRQQLSMNQVVPETELRVQIDAWIEQRRKSDRQAGPSATP